MSTEYNLLLGPVEMGALFNNILMGCVFLQVFQYYTTFRDPWIIRILVGIMFVLDITQTANMTYLLWEMTVSHFGDPSYLAKSPWMLASIPFFSVPISWITQGFYAWRIWILTDSKTISGLVCFFAVVQGLAGIGAGIGAFLVKHTADNAKLEPVAIIWFVCAIVCDTLITVVMVHTLSRARTGFKATDTLLTKVIRSVVETGLATTVIVALDAIFLFRFSTTLMHMAAVMPVGKVYSNSFLYILNGRARYRDGTDLFVNASQFAKSLDQSQQRGQNSTLRILRRDPDAGDTIPTSIHITRDTYQMDTLPTSNSSNNTSKADQGFFDDDEGDRSQELDRKPAHTEFNEP